jgi:ParB/RepB/Spo0J family partition protein
MTRLPIGKTRLDLVREAAANQPDLSSVKRGRMVVSLSRLAEDPKNERKTFRNLGGLVDSIKAVGIVEPITVTAEPDGTLRIVTGHRRFRAAQLAGLQQVEVIVRDPDDEKTRRLKSIVSNAQREDIGVVEMAEALQSLLDDGQFRFQRHLAAAIGKPESWVSDILSVLRLPTELVDRIRSSPQPVPYDTTSRIARLKDAHAQREMLDAYFTSGGSTGGTPTGSKAFRQQLNARAGKTGVGRTEASSAPKPKRVFHTVHKVTVIVQSDTSELRHRDVTAGLRDALDQAIRFIS